MSLSNIASIIKVDPNWISAQETRGESVALFRDYYDGKHRADMTTEMRRLLRIRASDGTGEFNDNYMLVVVDTMADRCNLESIEADNKNASAWAQEVLEYNRIDALQGDIHGSAISDGNTFLMVTWDNERQEVRLTHELAYDGTSGMIALYESDDVATMQAAIKIWRIAGPNGEQTRVNIYFPDRCEKYIGGGQGGSFTPFVDSSTDEYGVVPWVDRSGQPLGIPVIHFRNRGRHNYGESELVNAIPLQDALNRTLHSVVMTSELTGFSIMFAKGFDPGAAITPGAVIVAGAEGLTPDQIAELNRIQAGEVAPLLNVAQWLSSEIGKITRTPAPEFGGGDNASGEALKQREIGLLGKVRRFNVKAGNAWETVLDVGWRVQSAFGVKMPPDYVRFYARFRDPEIRNDKVTIENALSIAEKIGDQEFLRIIAPLYGWDETKIEQILEQRISFGAVNSAAMVDQIQQMRQSRTQNFDMMGVFNNG